MPKRQSIIPFSYTSCMECDAHMQFSALTDLVRCGLLILMVLFLMGADEERINLPLILGFASSLGGIVLASIALLYEKQ